MSRFGEKVNCNPRVKLNKGIFYPIIDIEKIKPGFKPVYNEYTIEYTGQSGAKFEDHDVLMARITPCLENGKIAIAHTNGNKGIGSTELFVFRGIEGVSNTDYIFYLLCMPHMRQLATNSMTGASGRQRADIKFIKKIEWSFPTLEKQQKIASFLSAYDNLIEVNNKRIKGLEQMAKNLYKEWFVRFRFLGHETTEFVNGLPKGWEYKKFKVVFTCARGVSYSTEEIECDDGENLINLKNIQSYGGFRKDGTKKYSGKYKKEQVVQENDLVMGVTDMTQDRRTVGAVALIPKISGIISADLIKLSSEINNVFSYCMFRFGSYSKFFSQFGNGANVIHLKPSSIENQKVLVPDNIVISLFVKSVEPIITLINEIDAKNDNLIKQRDLLLPRLMSGKLEV